MKAHRFGGLELSICEVVIPYVGNIFNAFLMYSLNLQVFLQLKSSLYCRNTVNSL